MKVLREAGQAIASTIRSRRTVWLAMGLTIALVITGFGLWRALRTPEDAVWQRIQDTGVWRVGMDPSFPPFESLDAGGQPIGLDLDLAKAIAAQWGATVSVAGVGFDGLLPALWADKVDAVVSALPVDPRMARDISYSIPYFEAGLLLVVAGDGLDVGSVDDLQATRLAVELGSEGDVQAREIQGRVRDITILPLPNSPEALSALTTGEADAALVDAVTFLQVSVEQPELRAVGDPVVSVPYVIAVSTEAPLLLEAVNEALVDLEVRGELDRLLDKWF